MTRASRLSVRIIGLHYRILGHCGGVGRSSGNIALSCKGLDHPAWWVDPAWRMHLQFGLFSNPTGGPQLVHQRMWYVVSMSVGKEPLLLIKQISLCVTMIICLKMARLQIGQSCLKICTFCSVIGLQICGVLWSYYGVLCVLTKVDQ